MWTVPLLESFKQPQCSWTVLCCILAVLLWFVSQASYCLFTDESCPVFVFVFVSGLRLLSYTEMIKQKWIFSLGVPPGDLPTLLWEWGAKVLCSLVWDNRNKKIKKKFVSQNCRWQRMIESWLVDRSWLIHCSVFTEWKNELVGVPKKEQPGSSAPSLPTSTASKRQQSHLLPNKSGERKMFVAKRKVSNIGRTPHPRGRGSPSTFEN